MGGVPHRMLKHGTLQPFDKIYTMGLGRISVKLNLKDINHT